ncbi:hypothetical protein [Paracoccus aminophilus]|uniref:DUF1127 domain-containing protein n=1 Tax=Paracoccus aminophilus JCM 7686 TaxID=1367847 RepID=S5XX14_PARAH|nr:hypothetical protein [Paracoccus aminophilus]AGT07980.1 hypothetical protein JCM7686_0871 [Paracoccus aminophilus JCM 7686]
MTALPLTPAHELRAPLDDLIDTHGIWAVATALIRAAIRRKNRPPPVTGLSDYLLRDIGLNRKHEPPDRTLLR